MLYKSWMNVIAIACLLALPVGCRKGAQTDGAALAAEEADNKEQPGADVAQVVAAKASGPDNAEPVSPAPKTVEPPPAPKNQTLELLKAAGDRAVLVLVIRPAQWKKFGDAVRPFWAPVAKELQLPVEVLDELTLLRAFRLRLGEAEGDTELPPLEGLDETRPIVAALFEPNPGPVAMAARFMAFSHLHEGGPGIAHRVLLPASDTAALAASVVAAIEAAGVRRRAGADDWKELKGGALFVPGLLEGCLAVIPEEGHVRLEMTAFETFDYDLLKEGVLAHWRQNLGRSPSVVNLPLTPALDYAASGEPFAVAYFRPWMMRDLTLQLAVAAAVTGLEYAPADQKQAMLARAVSAAQSAGLLMSPEGAEVDDLAVSVDVKTGLRFKAVASLTEYGIKVVREGIKTGSAAPDPLKPGAVDLSITFDLGAYFRAVEIPSFLEQWRDVSDSQMAFHNCGTSCYLYSFVRGSGGLWKWAAQEGGLADRAEQWLPSSVSLSLRGLDPANAESPVSFAFTSEVPAAATGGADLNFSLLEELLGGSMMYEVRAADGKGKVWGGIGADPAKVFGQQKSRKAGHLLAVLKVQPHLLSAALAGKDQDAAALARQVGQLDALVWFAGQALVTEVVVGKAGGLTVPYSSGPDMSGYTWESPDLARYTGKGGRCLAKVATHMGKAFRSLAMVNPASRQDLLQRTIEKELRANLDCAIADPLTREEAMAADLMLTLMIVDNELLPAPDGPEGDLARRRILAAGCKRGHQRLCEMFRADPAVGPQ